MRGKLIAALSGAVLATVLVASPAAAAKHVVVVDEDFDDTFVVPAEDSVCGVEETIHDVGSFKVTEYFDNDGNFVRAKVRAMGTTHVSTEFGEVVDRWSWSGTFDPETVTFTQAGNVFNVHAGAGGVLVNDSGRIVIDEVTGEALVINGPHQAWFGEFDDACAVLAP